MRYLYTFGIICYTVGVYVASLWNDKARQLCDGWRHTFRRLAKSPVGNGKTAWFHASSLGEFEQGRPIIEAFRKEHPDYKICLTFFSPSGYEVRKDYAGADFVCYLPPDTRDNARRFLNMLHPTVVFFVKYDYWFNYLEQLHMREVPTYIFSTIFRPGQYFFRWYGGWFRKHLDRCFTHIFVQNKESQKLLKSHGIGHCSVAGDTRFDRVHAIAQECRSNEVVEAFLANHQGKKVILAGSSWEPDEENLHRYLIRNEELGMRNGELDIRNEDPASGPTIPGIRNCILILAPHVIGEVHLAHIEQLFGKDNCLRYSSINTLTHSNIQTSTPPPSVLIIDNMGMLSSLYRYADVAYIGGGFGQGIHNILEAVTFGKPVVFGPNYGKFQEARDIIRLGGGFSYSDYTHLPPIVDSLLNDPETYQKASLACSKYMDSNLGATRKILSIIHETDG
ncbi:MAG: 3-deoxy-D-manno-octulosonic acid transferase [Bacteroidales bacterium]|nr:3-deoxy-D-manno-octulosonic acid transferase [Bacteroidales bacterium]